jgi:hypothetical protein
MAQFWTGFVTDGQHVSIQLAELDMISQVTASTLNGGGGTLNLWMLQLGVKMLLGTNVTLEQIFSGHSMQVKMSLRHFVGGRSVKVL